MSLSVTYYNLDRRQSLIGHRRLPKLKDFLKQLLAKQKSVVPASVLLDVAAHIVVVRGVARLEDFTYSEVRKALTALGMRNFFDYCTQIYCRLKGCPPPTLTPKHEEALFVLFAAIQKPFEDMKGRKSSTFFSMNYVVLTFCKFLGLSYLLPYITLSTTSTRLKTQQGLLERIFQHLNWSPFPRISDDDMTSV